METTVGRLIVRRDAPQTALRRAAQGLDARVAGLVGEGKRVRIFGGEPEPEALGRALEAQGCTVRIGTTTAAGGEPFDAIVLADLLGRIDDPQAFLSTLREQLGPEGMLIVTLCGIATIGDRLAIVAGGPLGSDSGVLFTEAGVVGLIEAAQYAVGHLERVEPGIRTDQRAGVPVHGWLIVAYPLALSGLDFIQRRMHTLAQEAETARRDACALRQEAALAAERIALYAGHEQRMASRIGELRRRLLEAHDQLIRRDDELRQICGDAIYQRHDLLIERVALLKEREALQSRLEAAESRLDRFRASPLGRAYRGFRKLFRR
jgi:hypothetical protein